MSADQAAGLRRRSAQQAPGCITCFFDSAESTVKLAHALHQRGATLLLVDACGRVFADSPARSLFDWKQQIQRGQLRTLPQLYGEGWHAPGVRADEPALPAVARGYDQVVFDVGSGGADLVLMPGAAHAMIVEIQATDESMLRAYILLKTLSHAKEEVSVGLLGDPAACEHVVAACRHFLERRFAQAICSVAHEDDAFSVLAARMAHGETSLLARYKTESTGTWP
jgi:hypothetical protein